MSRLNPPLKHAGISLIVVLLLLVLMSIVTLASLRGTLSSERMAAAGTDRNQALQEAEAALREAEARLIDPTQRTGWPTSGCNAGRCATPDAAGIERWDDPGFNGWLTTGIGGTGTSAGNAQYIIEFMGTGPNWPGCESEVPPSPNCISDRYRITSRSAPVGGRAAVILQSTFSTP